MTDEAVVTAESLTAELSRQLAAGLTGLQPGEMPQLCRLTREAGQAADEETVTRADLQAFIELAIGALDRDRFESSAAMLYGVGVDVDDDSKRPVRATDNLTRRSAAAAKAQHVSERTYRSFTDERSSRRHTDVQLVAASLLRTHRLLVRRATETRSIQVQIDSPPPALEAVLDGKPTAQWRAERTKVSQGQWKLLLDKRDEQLALLGAVSPKVCIFASGSFGRDEAMQHSDVDLFLVDDAPEAAPGGGGRLDKFELGQALTLVDRTREACGIQQFSQAGFYQEPQSFRQMLPETDAHSDGQDDFLTRPTTVRTLLLANSKCFSNQDLYDDLRQRALDHYWRGTDGDAPIKPIYLINDLRRLWLTILIDYEHFYARRWFDNTLRTHSSRQVARRKLLAQKLGCFTPILAMLDRTGPEGISRAQAEEVLAQTTWQRLESLRRSSDQTVAAAATSLRELYGQYLAYSWCDRKTMIYRAGDGDPGGLVKAHFDSANKLIAAMLWVCYQDNPEFAQYAFV